MIKPYTWSFVDQSLKVQLQRVKSDINIERRKLGQLSTMALKKKGNPWAWLTPESVSSKREEVNLKIGELEKQKSEIENKIYQQSISKLG